MLEQLTTTDVATYGLVGALLPLVVAIINRPTMPDWARQLVMVGFAVAAGAFSYGLKNDWDFSNGDAVVAAVLGVAAASQVAYRTFWGKAVAPAIERNVNSGQQATSEQPVTVDDPVEEDIPEGVDDDYEPQRGLEPVEGDDVVDSYVDVPVEDEDQR